MKSMSSIKTCLNLMVECQMKWPNFDTSNQVKLKQDVERFHSRDLFIQLSHIVSNNINSSVLYNYLDSLKCIIDIGFESDVVQFIDIKDMSDQEIRFDYNYEYEKYRISDIRMRCSICFGEETDVDECEVCDATGWF